MIRIVRTTTLRSLRRTATWFKDQATAVTTDLLNARAELDAGKADAEAAREAAADADRAHAELREQVRRAVLEIVRALRAQDHAGVVTGVSGVLLRYAAGLGLDTHAGAGTPELLVWVCEHDGQPVRPLRVHLGQETAQAEAEQLAQLRRGPSTWAGWIPDHGGPDAGEDLVLFTRDGDDPEGWTETVTGYRITPVPAATIGAAVGRAGGEPA